MQQGLSQFQCCKERRLEARDGKGRSRDCQDGTQVGRGRIVYRMGEADGQNLVFGIIENVVKRREDGLVWPKGADGNQAG